jgi:hypothetical protein
MDHFIVQLLLILLLVSHLMTHGLPLVKGIIDNSFELIEYAIDRAVTFREHWLAARGRWKAAG